MKKVLNVSLVLLLALFCFQQLKAYDFTVSGVVLETDLLVPVANHQVELLILQTGITGIALTGEDGTYSLTVMIPDTGSYHFHVQTYDYCNSAYIVTIGVPTPGGITENFVICLNGGGPFDCEADFDWQLSNSNPNEVHFTDLSNFQPGTWAWDFGDGQFSTERNPIHLYDNGGEYTVLLTIIGADSTCVDTYSEVIVLDTIAFDCVAEFDWYESNQTPYEVHFTDLSNFQPGTWAWDFGDGQFSTVRNPVHLYDNGGQYNVILTIIGADSTCVDTYSEVIAIGDSLMNCAANFWWHHENPNTNPLETSFVNFSYTYSPIIEFSWDFGDGNTSNEENPVHVYDDFGVFNVTLGILTESGCTSSRSIDVWLNDSLVSCMAMFVPIIDSISPLQVAFYDLSIGEINEWLYEFGDGVTSNDPNPVHIYPVAAVYEATLTVFADDCVSSFFYEIDLINGQVLIIPGGTTGVAEIAEINPILYPVPVENTLFINTYGNAPASIHIMDITGQTLIKTNANSIDVSQLPQGIYFAQININGRITTSKFIKM